MSVSKVAKGELGALKMSVILYVVVFAAKLAVFFATGVMALLAEALHTLSDVFVSGFLMVALWYSGTPADDDHHFGHGRAQYVAALVAATLFISFTGFELYREAIHQLLQHDPRETHNLMLAVGVLVASMFVAAAPLLKLLFQKERGAAAHAQLMELFNDELGLVAALVGTLLVHAGYPLADPIATLVVATLISANGVGIFRENLSYLLGRAPGREYLSKVETEALAVAGVLEVHDLRAEHIGPGSVRLDLHITVGDSLTVREGHDLGEAVRRRLHETMGCSVCTVHIDASAPTQPAE